MPSLRCYRNSDLVPWPIFRSIPSKSVDVNLLYCILVLSDLYSKLEAVTIEKSDHATFLGEQGRNSKFLFLGLRNLVKNNAQSAVINMLRSERSERAAT